MAYRFEKKKTGRLYFRFRKINLLLFTAAFCVMASVMMIVMGRVIASLSVSYAGRYALSSAEALGAHLERGTGLVSKMAHFSSVADWMADEHDEEKKDRAFGEMTSMVRELYSNNLYVVLESSRNEYRVRSVNQQVNAVPFKVLSEDDPDDAWYFECINSDDEYILKVAVDQEVHRKRVWIDYKVVKDGVLLGVICTGLEFSHVMNELFSHHDGDDIRGFIIDENGVILMDSSLTDDIDFLYSAQEIHIEEEFRGSDFHDAVSVYMAGKESGFRDMSTPLIVGLSSGQYRYVTMTPIRQTRWSVLVLSGSVSLFDMSNFMPVLATVLALLIAFALTTNSANYRLIFLPLSKLTKSLEFLRESLEGRVYGSERDDELGDLSRMIEYLFTKANVDALTGIRNRRFMENSLGQTMAMLNRSGGYLSTLMIDIDYFKRYNDEYGHDKGDTCLQAVALAIADSVTRADDFAARYGGEEFAVIMPNTDGKGARLIAKKILENVRSLVIPHSGSDVAPNVTVSVGLVAGKVTFAQSWEDYIKRADEALYMSKQNGRNQYTYLDFEEA